MTQIQLIGTTVDELTSEIINSLLPVLKKEILIELQPKLPPKYLTRKEVCNLLSVDLSTLSRWRNAGILPSFSIGNRVYIKRSDLDLIINKNKIS